jgi:hypothetical protein
MRVLVADRMGHAGAWSKRWSTLDLEPGSIFAPSEALTSLRVLECTALVIAHESAFPDETAMRAFERSLGAREKASFVLYVSHSGCSRPRTWGGGRIHRSGVAFPNSPAPLNELKPRLERLRESLLSCCREGEAALQLTWELWEDEPRDFIEALWGLCQTYLAATLAEAEVSSSPLDLTPYPLAAEWAERYTSALSRDPARHEAFRHAHGRNFRMVTEQGFWSLEPGPPDIEVLRDEWPQKLTGLSSVENLLAEISRGEVLQGTVLAALESLEFWAKESAAR